MQIRKLALKEIKEIIPRKFGDDRGFFAETWSRPSFVKHGVDFDWVQDNQSLSAAQFTLRGLHYQAPPFAQDKLVRVLKGRILDVAVDIRGHSPTYGHWVGLEISADAFNQILVPKGFAHGFLTLEPNTEVFYKVSAPFSAEHDRNILWCDTDIAVDWELGDVEPVLSAKDAKASRFADIENVFHFEEGSS